MQEQPTILEGYTDLEKGAYLCAIASLATADHSATEDELEYINALCQAAELSDQQTKLINHAAISDIPESELKKCLDVLKASELRFSLISDLIAFAQSDKNYSEEEKQAVEKMVKYLNINPEQYSVLDEFSKKVAEEAPKQSESLETGKTSPWSFLDNLGFGDKLKSAGINGSSLIKGALAIAGPLLLAKMFSGRRRGGLFGGGRTNTSGGGLFGGLLGGGGGLLGGLLGGGRGFSGAGGMISRLFGGGGRML